MKKVGDEVGDEETDHDGGTSAEVEWLGPAPTDGSVVVKVPATVSEGAQQVEVEVPPLEGCG